MYTKRAKRLSPAPVFFLHLRLQATQLERLEHMKDLGVIFDSELNFVQHCKEKINTAYSFLGIIKRNFIYLDEDAFVMLRKSLVRSHLAYANSVWNPHRLGLLFWVRVRD